VGLVFFWSFSVGFRPGFLPPWAYFRVCVSVAVFLLTQTLLYLRTFLVLFLSPLPRGFPMEGPDCRFPLEAVVLRWIRGGNFNFDFHFDLKYSWGRSPELISVDLCSRGRS
jgi:hypothetical protein